MDENGNSWFAVHTKSRQETLAREHLERQSFQCFLPMAGTREALFPGYLFLRANQQEQSLHSVRSTRGVIGLVRTGLMPSTVPAFIIDRLKACQDTASGLTVPHAAGLKPGERVRVFDGPFAPLEGVFQERRGQSRAMLLLEILGRNTTVEIDSRALQRLR